MASNRKQKSGKQPKWFKELSPAARCQLEGSATVALPESEERTLARNMLRQLSPAAREALEKQEPVDETVLPAGTKPGFCMVECADGEFPSLRIFRTLAGLIERIRILEGQDVSVWPFLGVPLPISKGPHRILVLPGGRAASITKNPSYFEVDLDEDDVEIQEDGFIGPEELSIAAPSYIDEDEAREEAKQAAAKEQEEEGQADEDDELPDPA